MKWAAVMALPVGLATFLSLSNIDQIRSFKQNYTGFLFPGSAPAVKRITESPKIILPVKKSVHPLQKIAGQDQPAPSTVSQEVKPEAREASGSDINKPYAIIVGAFRFRENADNLVVKLKEEGYDGTICDITATGLFRVSIGSYTGRDEAISQLAALRSGNYSSAWLLTK
jgi:cell division septation protein DedD